MDEKVRISKLLSERGQCSRREADTYISEGLVEVDGKVVTELGTRVLRSQRIELTKEAVSIQESLVTVILHKPAGYVSHVDDNHQYKPAVDLITPPNLFIKNQYAKDDLMSYLPGGKKRVASWKGLAPAGRLDIDSTGLLVLTEDGRVSKQIIGEGSCMEKEYLVRVKGNLSDRGLALLNHGLSLDGEELRPSKVKWQNNDQLSFILQEGKHRQIRRMCDLVGLAVLGLKRVRIGKVALGNLPHGMWRVLGKNEKF